MTDGLYVAIGISAVANLYRYWRPQWALLGVSEEEWPQLLKPWPRVRSGIYFGFFIKVIKLYKAFHSTCFCTVSDPSLTLTLSPTIYIIPLHIIRRQCYHFDVHLELNPWIK